MIDSTVPAAGLGGLIQRASAAALGLAALTVCTGAFAGSLHAQEAGARTGSTDRSIDWGSLGQIGGGELTTTESVNSDRVVLDDETGELFLPQDPQGEPQDPFADTPDDGDYSPQALFQRLHGNFLRSAFFYRPNLRVSYRFQSARDVDTTFGNNIQNDAGDFDVNQFEAEWNYNYAIDPDFFLITGLEFGADQYDFNGTAPQLGDETLYQISGKIGAGWFVSDDFLLQGYYAPGYYSDLDGGTNSDDVQNFGRLMATVKLDDSFYIHGGFEVSAVFEDVPIYPILGLTAILSEEWRIDLLAPRELAIRFSPEPSWTFSAGLQLDGDEFSYRSGSGTVTNQGVPPTTFNFASQQLDINIQEFRLFAEALYRVNNQFSLYGRFGSTLSAKYNYRLPQGSVGGGAPFENGDFDGVVNPNLLLEVGIGFDI